MPPLARKNKKLTEFFVQKPSSSPGPVLATSSTHVDAKETTAPAARRRPTTRASTTATDRESSVNSGAPAQIRSTPTTLPRKRARSPDSNNTDKSPFPSSKLKSPRSPIIYIASPFSRGSVTRKSTPARMQHSLAASPSNSSKQIVYSSQSDEAELVLPVPEPRDLGKVVEGVHTWRRKTFESSNSSASHAREDAMEVDPFSSSPTRGSPGSYARSAPLHSEAPVHSAATPRNNAASQTSVVASANLLSPPTNEFPPLPPTPKSIDPETKTAKIIADIKARAFATHQSSDDEQSLSLRELEESDDDELIDDLPLIGAVTREKSSTSRTRGVFSSPLSSAPSTFGDTAIGLRTRRTPDHDSPPLRQKRASARTRKPTQASHLAHTVAESSTSARIGKPVFPNQKKSQAANPLRALLREKELEDKRGASCTALRLAEEAAKQGSPETSVGSDDELGTLNRLHLADEQAAWKAVHEYRKSTSPSSPGDVEDLTIGDHESNLLGAVAGEAVNKILADDKDSKGKRRAQSIDEEMTMGVSLWIPPPDEKMEVDSMPTLPLSGHSVFACIDDCRRDGDVLLLNLILRSGALAAVPRDTLLSNIPQLFAMALLSSSQVADAVCTALRDLWSLNSQKVQMPFPVILAALVQLGADPSVLEGLGFVTERGPENHVTRKTLLEALKRFLAIIKAAGFAGAFSPDDVASVVLSLVVMGLDPLTSNELHMQVNATIDVVCNHATTDYLLQDIHERVLVFAKQLAPINQARLVSFFASGSGRSRRIARHLAYCLLVTASIPSIDQIPPLEPLIILLSPDCESCDIFDVANESTNYGELRQFIIILSMALIDIAPYVQQERDLVQSASSTSVQGSPSKTKRTPVPPLELLRKSLEALQGRIVDTRAAHLDRSRTKATIQRLTMRIHYERLALLGVRTRRRESTLKAYFSPQRR